MFGTGVPYSAYNSPFPGSQRFMCISYAKCIQPILTAPKSQPIVLLVQNAKISLSVSSKSCMNDSLGMIYPGSYFPHMWTLETRKQVIYSQNTMVEQA